VGRYLVERRGEVGACRGGLMYRKTPKGNSKPPSHFYPLPHFYQASLPVTLSGNCDISSSFVFDIHPSQVPSTPNGTYPHRSPAVPNGDHVKKKSPVPKPPAPALRTTVSLAIMEKLYPPPDIGLAAGRKYFAIEQGSQARSPLIFSLLS